VSQVRNWIGGVSDGKNSRSARAPVLVNLDKTGIIDIAQRGSEIRCRLQSGRNPGGVTRNFGTALSRHGHEPIILVNKPNHFIVHNLNSEQTQSLGAARIE